jgi:hypothetical protein
MVGSDILIKKKFLEYREFSVDRQTYFSFFKVQKENSRREDTSNERYNNNKILKNRKLTNEIF